MTDENVAHKEVSINDVLLTQEIAAQQHVQPRQVQRWINDSRLGFKATPHQIAALFEAGRLKSMSNVKGIWLVKKSDLSALLARRRPAGRPRQKA